MSADSDHFFKITDIGPGPLACILKELPVKDVCRAAETSRAFREAAASDTVWEAKAREIFPPLTTVSRGPGLHSYPTFRDLVQDDNRRGASLVTTLENVGCDYKYNRPNYYFDCVVTAIELDRTTDELKVFYDARGEADLRDPMTSSIGVVVHHDNVGRRELRLRAAAVTTHRRELLALAERLEPRITHDPDAAARHHSALVALNAATARMVGMRRELSEESSASAGFGDLVTVLRPSNNVWAVEPRPGHFKGCLTFPQISQIDSLAAELPASYRLKQGVATLGMDLLFCYACPIPILPHPQMVDYHHAAILKIRPGATLAGAFKAASYAVPGATMQRLKEESAEEERQRWALAAVEISADRNFDEWFVS